VIGSGINVLVAPKAVSDNTFVFMPMNFKDFRWMQTSFVIKAENNLTFFDFINSAISTWSGDKRLTYEAATAAAAASPCNVL
jgi:hypothetical protein